MKVKLVGRKLYLPKELVERARLPENGICEAILFGDEVRIRRELKDEELNMTKLLKKNSSKSNVANIDQMSKAEEVDDD